MNIQSSDLISLFSGFDGLDNIQQTLQTDGVLPEEFAQTLLAQLQQIQAGGELPEQMADPASAGQDIARLSGMPLPETSPLAQIDLQQTLDKLSQVLSKLETDKEKQSDNELINGELTDELQNLIPQVTTPVIQQAENLAEKTGRLEDEIKSVLTKLSAPPEPQISALPKTESEPEQLLQDTKPASAIDNKMVPLDIESKKDRAEFLNQFNPETKNNDLKAQEAAKLTDSDELMQNDKTIAADKGQADSGFNEKNDKTPEKMADQLAALNRSFTQQAKIEIPTVARPVTHPQWGQEFSDKVVWMLKQNTPSAELNLNPRNLGPVTVRIDVTQDQTNISFHTHHGAVKDAIEAALPRLKEMLNTQQLNLGEVNVSQNQSEQKQDQRFTQTSADSQHPHSGNSNPDDTELAEGQPVSVAEEIEAGRAIASQGILSIFA